MRSRLSSLRCGTSADGLSSIDCFHPRAQCVTTPEWMNGPRSGANRAGRVGSKLRASTGTHQQGDDRVEPRQALGQCCMRGLGCLFSV